MPPVSLTGERPVVDVLFDIAEPVPSMTRVMAGLSAKYPDNLTLAVGYPASEFTREPSRRAINAAMRRRADTTGVTLDKLKASFFAYGPTAGDTSILAILAGIINSDFSGNLDSTRMIPTNGNTQAISIFTAQMRKTALNKPAVLVDERTYTGVLSLLADEGITPLSVKLDNEGPIPESLRETITKARSQGFQIMYYYTVPDGHNPTGLTFSLQRRKDILKVCQDLGVTILEDSAYSYIRLRDVAPIPPLAFLDTQGIVAFAMSFSKAYLPGKRLAFLHVPFDWKLTSGRIYNLIDGLLLKLGLQTLLADREAWLGLLAHVSDRHGQPRSLFDVSKKRAAYYGTMFNVLNAGLNYFFKDKPDVFTWRQDVTHGFFTEGIYGRAPRNPKLDTYDAGTIGKALFDQSGLLTMPQKAFLPPDSQLVDPDADRRLRLCFSYTPKMPPIEALGQMHEAVNAFGQGVSELYGLPALPAFTPMISGIGFAR